MDGWTKNTYIPTIFELLSVKQIKNHPKLDAYRFLYNNVLKTMRRRQWDYYSTFDSVFHVYLIANICKWETALLGIIWKIVFCNMKKIGKKTLIFLAITLDSGIDVGPTFIYFGFFPDPTALLEST